MPIPPQDSLNTLPEWEKKIREDYAGLVSVDQIDATVEYWRSFIEQEKDKARREQADKIAGFVGKRINEMTDFSEDGEGFEISHDVNSLDQEIRYEFCTPATPESSQAEE